MRIVSILLAASVSLACGGEKEQTAPPPPPPPAEPIRGAVGDTDLRVMLAELASAKACERIADTFRGLRAEGRKDVTTGVLWMRDCKITNDGTSVTFRLGGQGWQWTEKKQQKAGAEFEVRDYVKFDVRATIHGAIDIGYDRDKHIVSLWFSPTKTPDIKFTPLGDIPVDENGLWSSIVGGIATAATESPEEQSKDKAEQQGEQTFAKEMVKGMTVAIDLCTGYQRFSMGRPAKGELGPPDPGETKQRPIEIQPRGMIVFGPYEAPKGMHVTINSNGPIRVGLACLDDVKPAVAAHIAEQQAPLIETLAQRDITGKGELEIKKQSCKVVLVVRSLAQHEVMFDWQRPPREIAQSTGGPAIHCERKQTVSSERDGSAGSAAARRR